MSWTPPRAILGVHDIYDILALLQSFSNVPEYRDSVSGAFGRDEKVYETLSPAHGDWLCRKDAWGDDSKRLLVLAHSKFDDLVDWKQVELMTRSMSSV